MKTIVAIVTVLFYALVLPDTTNCIVVVTSPIIPPQPRVIRGHVQQPQQRPRPVGMAGRVRQARGLPTDVLPLGMLSPGSSPAASLPIGDSVTLDGVIATLADVISNGGNGAGGTNYAFMNALGDANLATILAILDALKELPCVPAAIIDLLKGLIIAFAEIVRAGGNTAGLGVSDALNTLGVGIQETILAIVDALMQGTKPEDNTKRTRRHFHGP